MDKKIKALAIGDGVTPTGFSRVMHSIFGRLAEKDYEIHHLAVNYHGDPHDYKYKIYPAMIGGDVYGIRRLQNFVSLNPDIIFILNDLWVINEYLKEIRKLFKNLPKIVVYFPVDAENLDPDWFLNFDIVTQAVVYTEFGQSCVLDACKNLNTTIRTRIITHGVSKETFFKIPKDKKSLKKLIYSDKDEFIDSFIVLSANQSLVRLHSNMDVKNFL